MSEVIARPATGTTKIPTRSEAAPSPTPEPVEPPPSEANISNDEMTAATSACELLQSSYDDHWTDIPIYSGELMTAAIEALQGVCEKRGETDAQSAFERAAAAIQGAVEILRKEQPDSPAIATMEQAFSTLESAALSYGFAQEPCKALANGIRTGVRSRRRLQPQGTTADYIIARNPPGEIHLDSQDELERFVLKGSDVLASLNVCLAYLVQEQDGPNQGFVADFATHVNDLMYEHQTAVKWLLDEKAGDA